MVCEKNPIFFYFTCFIPIPPSEPNEQTNQIPVVLPLVTQVLKRLCSLLGQNMTEDIEFTTPYANTTVQNQALSITCDLQA